MSIFDWLGPLNAGRTVRGWDRLPAAEQKSLPDTIGSANLGSGGTFIPLDATGTVLNVNRFVQVTPAWTDADAAANSAVFACLQAVGTALAEPELVLYRVVDGERVQVAESDAVGLLRAPNPHMTLDTLLWYLAVCLKVDGNAYWRKLRAGDPETGNVVELWPISPANIEPVTRPGSVDFVSSYRYTPGNAPSVEIAPSNIVHFRTGLDDRDHRLGIAPLRRLLREISSDMQATRYADRLLANLAIAGLALTFDKEAPPISQATADELKARITAAYGGDNVGGVAVVAPGGTLGQLGFSPEQMDLQVLHRVPEERISAVLGVPAIVAGLGAGLDRATYANFKEAREAFTEQTLIPMWRAIAATITLQLVPDFTSDRTVVVDFDTANVRALADDQNANATRLKTLVEAGILTEDEARAEIGYGPKPEAVPSGSDESSVISSQSSVRGARLTVLRTEHRRLSTDACSRSEHKAIEDIPGELADLRAEADPEWLVAYERWLRGVDRRVQRRLRSGADSAGDLVPDIEVEILAEIHRPLALGLLGDVSDMVAAELAVSFVLDDPATRRYLAAAGANIVGITETTRRAVAEALTEGQQAGEGIPELARRLRGLATFGQARAETIARTELGHAQMLSALSSYGASGVVVGVTILDGDYDGACAARNGTRLTLAQANGGPHLLHPRCTAAYAPIVDAAELAPANVGGREAAG